MNMKEGSIRMSQNEVCGERQELAPGVVRGRRLEDGTERKSAAMLRQTCAFNAPRKNAMHDILLWRLH